VAVHGELWGQKWFSFKPPLVMPAIMQLCRVTALGHIEEGVGKQELAPKPRRAKCVATVNTDRWHPYGFDTWHSFQAFSDMPLAYF
jgi:hypothetical protein